MCVTIDVLDVTGDDKKRNTCDDGNGASTCSVVDRLGDAYLLEMVI